MKDSDSNPEFVIVNGVRYVPEVASGPIKILVIECGFVYVGRVDDRDGCDEMTISIYNARSLIRWGTSQHLGELVNGPLENTKLGASCTVRVRESKIIHVIEVNQDAWNKHCGA